MDLADLLGLLVDLIPDRLADARRSEARAQSVDKMLAAMQRVSRYQLRSRLRSTTGTLRLLALTPGNMGDWSLPRPL